MNTGLSLQTIVKLYEVMLLSLISGKLKIDLKFVFVESRFYEKNVALS